tara:strand:+ start:469 stop:840 length:372 start_codon:yes stop_codon:yes gene_type:complete
MIKGKNDRDFELEDFFAAAKQSAPAASEALKYKILNTSEQEFKKSKNYTSKQFQNSWWYNLFKEFGGFYSVVGYGTVATIGIFIGLSSTNWSNLILQFEENITIEELELADPFIDLSSLYLEE